MKPLAIDLFESELRLRTDSAIKKFVARWAQYPDHMPLGVGDYLPSAIAFEFWPVCYLKDSILSAGFACAWNIWVLSAHSTKNTVFEWTFGIVGLLNARVSAMECPTLFAGRFAGAVGGAVAAVGVRRRNLKMFLAAEAMSACFRYIGLLAASASTGARLARRRAITLVRAFCLKWTAAIRAKQIIHIGSIS